MPNLKKLNRRVTRDIISNDGRKSRENAIITFYEFGTLESCREAWESIHGGQIWPNIEEVKEQALDIPF